MYLAHLTEAFYGFGMGLGGDGVAKLLALAFGMACLRGVFDRPEALPAR
jgi:hypothetical protein